MRVVLSGREPISVVFICTIVVLGMPSVVDSVRMRQVFIDRELTDVPKLLNPLVAIYIFSCTQNASCICTSELSHVGSGMYPYTMPCARSV